MVKRTYASAVKLTEDTWRLASKSQKEELLNELGYDESWVKAKTINELVRCGGGMVANDLLKLNRELIKRRGGKVTINWN